MSKQPEALRLIDQLDEIAMYSSKSATWALDVVNEMERLHTENLELQQMCANQAKTLLEMHKTQEELVEALEHSVTVLEKMNCTAYTAKAAIAKAKGESNE